ADGGLTWGSALSTADGAHGIGGQPLVQPTGKVIVPITGGVFGSMLAFSSNDGGANWSSTVTVSSITDHTEAGGLRSGPLPSAEIDANGTAAAGQLQDQRDPRSGEKRGTRARDHPLRQSVAGPAAVPVDVRRAESLRAEQHHQSAQSAAAGFPRRVLRFLLSGIQWRADARIDSRRRRYAEAHDLRHDDAGG